MAVDGELFGTEDGIAGLKTRIFSLKCISHSADVLYILIPVYQYIYIYIYIGFNAKSISTRYANADEA